MIITNGKIYKWCRDCKKLVRLNKPIFGSLHLCVTEAESEELSRRRRESVPSERSRRWRESETKER